MENPLEPHNREAEEALLGAVLIDPSIHYSVSGFLAPSDFYIHRNGWVWEAFSELVAKQIPIDTLTLCDELERRGRLDEAGGASFIAALMNNVPTSLHAEAYGHMISEMSVRRQLLSAAGEIAVQAHDSRIPEAEVLSHCLEAIKKITDKPKPNERIPDALEVAMNWADYIAQRKYSLPTGIPKLDEKLGGLELKTQMVLAAKTGKGKSAMAFQIARNCASAGIKTIYFSMEMAQEALWARAACGSVGVMYRDILSGKAPQEQKDKAIASSSELAHKYLDNLLIDDRPRTSDEVGRIVMRERPKVVIIDHARFVKDQGDNENKRLGKITQNFHEQAKETDSMYITCCQLNRYMDHRDQNEPQLSDLRDSGEIEENADTVLMLHWPKQEAYTEGMNKIPTDLWIRKFRNGPHDVKIQFLFDVLHQWFEGMEISHSNGKSRAERMMPPEQDPPF